jgi:hypothetical protein
MYNLTSHNTLVFSTCWEGISFDDGLVPTAAAVFGGKVICRFGSIEVSQERISEVVLDLG